MNEATTTLTPEDVARELHVASGTIVQAIEDGQLAAERIGDSYAITLTQLQAFMQGSNPFTAGVSQLPTGGAWRREDPDDVLMDWAQAGDKTAFDELVRRFRPPCVSLCRNLVGAAEADDLAQESLIKAFRFREKFKPGRPFWPWLHRITFNTCQDALKPRLRDKFEEVSLDEPFDGDETEDVLRSDLLADAEALTLEEEAHLAVVGEAVSALPAEEQTDLLIVLTPGGSLHELARRRKITYNAAKKRTIKALQCFKAALEARGLEVESSGALSALGKLHGVTKR